MAPNPFAREMRAEESLVSRELSCRLTQALADRRVRSEADAATTATTRRPPRPVTTVYQRALDRAARTEMRRRRTMTLDTALCYGLDGTSWRAAVDATARFRTEVRGGVCHTLANGETLWSVAERYYGHGGYWQVIADANARVVGASRRVLVCGATLQIPRIEVVPAFGDVRALERAARPTPVARRRAEPVSGAFPPVSIKLGRSSRPFRTQTCVSGARVELTIQAKGEISGQKRGTVASTFSWPDYQTEFHQKVGDITGSFRITGFTVDQLQLQSPVLGGRYTLGFSIDGDGSFGASLSPQPINLRMGDFDISGNIGFEVRVRIVGTCREQVPEPIARRSRDRSGEMDPETARMIWAGVALAALVGIVVVICLGTAGACVAGAPQAAQATAAILLAAGVTTAATR